MSKVLRLTDHEADILDGLISAEIESLQEGKHKARLALSEPLTCDPDEVAAIMERRIADYDYFVNRLHELYQIGSKICFEEPEY